MKTLLAIVTLLFGAAAFACPNLKGKYNCAGDVVRFSQSTTNGLTTYTLDDGDPTDPIIVFTADRTPHSTKETYTDFTITKTVMAACIGNTTVNVNAVEETKDLAGNLQNTYVSDYAFSLSGSDLYVVVKEDGNTERMTCRRR